MSLNTNIRRIVIVPGQRASGVVFDVEDETSSARSQAQIEFSEEAMALILSEAISGLGGAVAEVSDAKPAKLAATLHQMREAKHALHRALDEKAKVEQAAAEAEDRHREAQKAAAALDKAIAKKRAELESLERGSSKES